MGDRFLVVKLPWATILAAKDLPPREQTADRNQLSTHSEIHNVKIYKIIKKVYLILGTLIK